MHRWEHRKQFLCLTKEEERTITALQPLVAEHVDELVAAFYRHLLTFPGTRKFLSDDLISTRLLDAQKRYLLSMVTGPFDETYEESRRQIGRVHARIGLTPGWYLGAYALYLSLLDPLILEQFQDQPEIYLATRIALTKIVFLDIQLAMEAYIDKSAEAQEFATQQLAGLSHELEQGLNRNRQVLLETQRQLRLTERVAELGTLAASMAHEIGTPLNVIMGRAEYLMERTTDDTILKGLHTIVAQVDRVTRLVKQLLSLTRRSPGPLEPVNLSETVLSCLDVMQEHFGRHKITVVTDFDEGLHSIHGNHDQLMQVVMNLVLNAVHAMPDGGHLTVRANGQNQNRQVQLSIADTGHGIPADLLPKIFHPFVTTKESGKGTGLGLTVVHGIVQEHGGSITVDSASGHGTTFRLLFPVPIS
ncbi:MAG: protoglobin domain-containing protein [Nitrospira sp. BO4]|jgi:signal transduction histidine kinase|nr:protoglobin domain-containing protein [Nitrospira sp. BO4]